MDAKEYITVVIFLVGIIFYSGYLAARVSSLEQWRTNVRSDMHEISNILTDIRSEIATLLALADRRKNERNG